ncbi:MAG TPA: hypothetical protein DCM05_00525 [Elusimicrobia bacterium]|nr:hypothetical protein [Elusimicrobiota bacterium]
MPFVLAALVVFGALARGAHDLWAATLVYLAALGLLAWMALESSWSEETPGWPALFLLPLAGVAGVFGLSYLSSPSPSWLGWTDWLAACVFFLAALRAFRSEESLDALLRIVAPLFWVELALVLWQRLNSTSFLGFQPGGTMVNSNLLAAFTVLWLPPLLAQRSHGAWAAALCLLSLNSAWGVVCALLASLWIFDPRAWAAKRPKEAAFAGSVLAAAAVALVGAKLEGFASLSQWWLSGFNVFRNFPWLGAGIGSFPSVYLAFKTAGAAQHTLFAHSNLIALLAETGLLGVLSLAVLLGVWWKHAVPARKPYLAGLAAFALFGLVSLSLEYLVNLLCAAMFLGIAAAPDTKQDWKPRKAVGLVLAALCLAAVPFTVSPFLASRKCVAAEERLAAGSAEEAVRLFRGALSLDARSVEARRGLARALMAQHENSRDRKDLERAADVQREAIQRDLFNGMLYGELGEILMRQGLIEEGAREFDEAVQLNAPDKRFAKMLSALRGGVER